MGPEPETPTSQQFLALDSLRWPSAPVERPRSHESGLRPGSDPSCELRTHKWPHTGHAALHTERLELPFPGQGSVTTKFV